MVKIESSNNVYFKELKKLKDRKGRTKAKKYIIEGFRLVQEAYIAKASIESILVTEESLGKLGEYFKEGTGQCKVIQISESLFKEIAATENPQGILAVGKIEEKELEYEKEFFLVGDKLQDPGNLGTIIRTAHAAGVGGIILTKGTVDLYNEKVLRSSMGSLFHLPIVYDDDNFTIIKRLKNEGYSILATSLDGDRNFFEEDLSGKLIITVGNEGNGVSDQLYDLSDKKVKLPMPGGAESLNVAIATGIVLYEKVRQNSIKK